MTDEEKAQGAASELARLRAEHEALKAAFVPFLHYAVEALNKQDQDRIDLGYERTPDNEDVGDYWALSIKAGDIRRAHDAFHNPLARAANP
jgi:hypothetical protein